MRNPYEVLGVPHGSVDDEAIKSAFRSLAKEHHPDKHGGSEEAKARFQEISAAYEQIKNNEKRREYAMSQRQHRHEAHGGFGGFQFRADGNVDFEAILREFHRQQNQPRNRNYSTDTVVSLLHAFHGTEVELKLAERTIRVKIPPGVDTGTRIRVAGAGENVHANLPPGDLFVTVFVEGDPRFARNGKNLYSDVQIDVFDAILGGVVSVPTIDGGNVDVNIRSGVQQDHQINLSGKGMPIIGTESRGDHIITIKLRVPNDLTDEQKELVKKIRDLPK
jgi:curved DNA-binding protein